MQKTLERIGNPKGFCYDPSLVLYLPLHQLDGSSFMSKDAYGHLCTVTGALWRPDGHWFDGMDDFISCGNNASLDMGTGDFSIEMWVKRDDITSTYKRILNKTQNRLEVRLPAGADAPLLLIGDGVNWHSSEISVTSDKSWHHYVFERTSSGMPIYFDGEEQSVSYNGVMAFDGDISTTDNLEIGRMGASWFNGTIGEVRFYSRALSPLEAQNIYLATKWRYR